MTKASLLKLLAGFMFSEGFGEKVERYFTKFVHRTKTGPSRSQGVKRKNREPGAKLGKLAFEGRLGLRGRVLSGASLLAQQGQLGQNKNR